MIQCKANSLVIDTSAAALERLRHQFALEHCVKLPGFLAPELLRLLQTRLEAEGFAERTHEGIGANKELCQSVGIAPGLLHFLLNNRRLFEVIETITQCGSIGCFTGRIYRVVPGQGHHDAWHDDLGEQRLVALSINLSPEVYAGGWLQMRDQTSGALVREAANTGFGDALLFRLAPWLKHRITEVEGAAAKTAYAGWFKSQPNLAAVLKTPAMP